MTLIKKFSTGICYLQLNRPEKKNALSITLLGELTRFFEESGDSSQFHVLVLSGNGGFFSSGADLDWMRQASTQDQEQNLADAQHFNRLYAAMFNYPKPIVVRVDKGAYGGALGLLACADVVTTGNNAQFAFSEVRLGLVPATVAPWVVQRIGASNARALFLSAAPFDAEAAKASGLVNHVFPEEKLGIKTRELATQIAQNSPAALRATKILLNRLALSVVPVDEELQDYCAGLIAGARTSPDGQEGVAAFFEKRKAKWNFSQGG